MAAEQQHLMMFPWLAFGHLLPFLEFSKKLAAKGVRVSFVSTPKNLQRLPPIPADISDRIKLLEVPLPLVDGLSENCEATIDVQPEQTQYLKKAYDRLAEPMEKLMQKELPDLILVDFAAYWIPQTAAKFGVPVAFFSAYTAATLAFLGPPGELISGTQRKMAEQFTRPPDWITFPSLIAHRPHYAPRAFQNLHFPDISGLSSGQRIAKVVQGSSFVAVKSCREFEGEYILLVEKLYQRPVLPIGVLPPMPFIWILRKPEEAESLNIMPPGFLTRTSNQGIVCLGWAPQLEILAHLAIGGCLFHSGWGSIIECLGFGHPLILMPMVYDQTLNAKLLAEKEVGYEVPTNIDGSFSREHVAKSIRMVMVEPEGEQIRANAAQMHTVFSNQDLHDNILLDFITRINFLLNIAITH